MKFVFLATAICLIGCKQESQQPSAPSAALVTTANAISEDLPTYILLPGITQSVHAVEIQARVEGWLEERHFEEGKIVQKGDLLYKIDTTSFEAQLLQAEAALASSKVQANYATKELARNGPLFRSGAISQQSFDQLQTEAEQAEAQVLVDVANVELAEINLGYCSIYTPITGLIGKTSVHVGTLVGPTTNSKLTEVIQQNPMYVEFYPPANRLGMIQESLQKREPMPIHLTILENESEGEPSTSTSAMTTKTITGSLVFVDNEIQSSTSTILARGEFINTSNVLPGQYVQVKLQLQMEHDATMIPTKSIMQQPGSFFVWTISKDNTAVITPVTLGSILGDKQHVRSGLKAGDQVIIEGMKNLRSGQKVSIADGLTEED